MLSALALAAGLTAELRYGTIALMAPVANNAPARVQRPDSDVSADKPPLDAGISQIPALAGLPETAQRPLFQADRRAPPAGSAPPPTAQVTAPVPSNLNLVLSAIVFADEERVAYFVDPKTGGLMRVEEGKSTQGWRLETVKEDQVIMVRGERRETIVLRTYQPPPLEAAPPSRSQAAAKRASKRSLRLKSKANASEGAVVKRPRRPKRGPRQEALKRARAAVKRLESTQD